MKSKSTKAGVGDRYSKFLNALDPVVIALIHSAFRIDREEYLRSENDEIALRLLPELIRMEGEHFDVRVSLSLFIRAAKSRKAIVRFSATYDLHFHGAFVTEANVKAFVESDVRLIIWPYFREFVNNSSARMHVPPIILPVSGQTKGRGES
jgi:hypothetical protein